MEGIHVSVECCARCQGSHADIAVRPLANHARYTHWAMCPTLIEPILLVCEPTEGETLTKGDIRQDPAAVAAAPKCFRGPGEAA